MTPDATIDTFRIERQDLPENISKVHVRGEPRDDCWHCHNSVHQGHRLRCPSCGHELRGGPAIQELPNCWECGDLWECVSATVRWEDRGKVYYHPETGEELAIRDQTDGAHRHVDPDTGEPVDYPEVLEERGLA